VFKSVLVTERSASLGALTALDWPMVERAAWRFGWRRLQGGSGVFALVRRHAAARSRLKGGGGVRAPS
jgi:hypothetical protein